MQAITGMPVVATLPSPSFTGGLGARIEVPVTRAIVSAFTLAVAADALWTVTLDPPPTAGDYLLVWRTDEADPVSFEAFVPLVMVALIAAGGGPAATLADITPDVTDVAVLLRARTNAGGTEQGTFNDDTRPTGADVTALIAAALSDVSGRVAAPIPVAYAADAKRLVALQTATLIEASYFPNALDSDRSAYTQYTAMYLAGVAALVEAARRPGALRLR
jgi:hypothetical protein